MVYFTPRCGSTLLCSFFEQSGFTNYCESLQHFDGEGNLYQDNIVFKVSSFKYAKIFMDNSPFKSSIVYLYRRNVTKQAVSYAIADYTKTFIVSSKRIPYFPEFLTSSEIIYNSKIKKISGDVTKKRQIAKKALKTRDQLVKSNKSMKDIMERFDCPIYNIAYEDLISDPSKEMRKILGSDCPSYFNFIGESQYTSLNDEIYRMCIDNPFLLKKPKA
jgi:LPS sulfotransferase NodH